MPKTKTEPKPRAVSYYGMRSTATHGTLGTWLEPEELTYPSGAMVRRARAINVETGKLVVIRCGIPDTYFTIPCRGGGYLDSSDGGTFRFHPPAKKVVPSVS